jgi:hypothetical protein
MLSNLQQQYIINNYFLFSLGLIVVACINIMVKSLLVQCDPIDAVLIDFLIDHNYNCHNFLRLNKEYGNLVIVIA